MSDPLDIPIRIFILDHYAMVRAGLRSIIDKEPGLKVIGEAGDSNVNLEMAVSESPNIILLTLNTVGDPGLEVIPRLLEIWSRARIILTITTEDYQLCEQAVQMGVLGIVSKSLPPQILFKAIQKVHEGEVWIDHLMMAHLLNTMTHTGRLSSSDPDTQHINQLSERERQVIQLIGVGLKNKQIATQLCISETTVRHHLTSIFNKLGVSDRLELLVFATRSGLTRQ